MIKQNNFKEFDTFSRRKFLESLGMRFYTDPAFSTDYTDEQKSEKPGNTAIASKPEAAQKENNGKGVKNIKAQNFSG
ncbi:MAG TPA: hypothetical protein VEC12_05665 [Bacteroidia bacterium]|nr:hypothetical protein [Bacteroidia bacterium]